MLVAYFRGFGLATAMGSARSVLVCVQDRARTRHAIRSCARIGLAFKIGLGFGNMPLAGSISSCTLDFCSVYPRIEMWPWIGLDSGSNWF